MPTYRSNLVTAGAPAKTGIETVQQIATLTVGTALIAADVLEMVPVPKGARITNIQVLASGSLGSTLTASIGDGAATARFAAAAALGQGGASYTTLGVASGASLGFQYTVNDTIDIVVATAAGGTTGVTITMVVTYIVGDMSI